MELQAHHLTKSFNKKSVVSDVSIVLHGGEVVALLGPNGAGKTTTVGMLYGAVTPDSGAVKLGGWDIAVESKEAKRRIGVVTQDNNLDPDFDCFENLLHFAHHYGLSRAEARQRSGELLKQFDLQQHAKKSPEELSGGLRRRLVLARALIHRPQFILLDEPTTGLDPDARQDLWKTISVLRQEGRGILLTTHYMDEAQRLSDRALLMQEGKIIDEGSADMLIGKLIGREVVELEGADETEIKGLADEFNVWSARFGAGAVIALPPDAEDALWQRLELLKKSSLRRRQANLEDVFLKLTGRGLQA